MKTGNKDVDKTGSKLSKADLKEIFETVERIGSFKANGFFMTCEVIEEKDGLRLKGVTFAKDVSKAVVAARIMDRFGLTPRDIAQGLMVNLL
jgi:hypothetical protein